MALSANGKGPKSGTKSVFLHPDSLPESYKKACAFQPNSPGHPHCLLIGIWRTHLAETGTCHLSNPKAPGTILPLALIICLWVSVTSSVFLPPLPPIFHDLPFHALCWLAYAIEHCLCFALLHTSAPLSSGLQHVLWFSRMFGCAASPPTPPCHSTCLDHFL